MKKWGQQYNYRDQPHWLNCNMDDWYSELQSWMGIIYPVVDDDNDREVP
jgi:hypothetical protein